MTGLLHFKAHVHSSLQFEPLPVLSSDITNSRHLHLLIAAAGSGRRMGAEGNKLLLPVAGRAVLAWTLDAALASSAITWIGLVGQPVDEQAIRAIVAAANGRLKGILGYTDQPNVSCDFNHDPHSSIFHADQTLIMGGDMVRVLSWYDNEWAFSNRMADTAVTMGKLI